MAHPSPLRRARIIWAFGVFLVMLAAAAAAETGRGMIILTAVQRFLLFYSGVFALIALTAAVGLGLAATDRIIMRPAGRIAAQRVHRAVSLTALAFLVLHIVTETLAHRSGVADAFVPFLAQERTFYLGLGTIASDLVLIVIVTGIGRGRFGRWPWAWRAIHAAAYLCWLLALVHGLRAGRTPMPYVDWSYGACAAAIVLALVIRLAGTVRDRRRPAPGPAPGRAAGPVPARNPATAHAGRAAGAHALRRPAPRLQRLRRGALAGWVLPGPKHALAGQMPALLPLRRGHDSTG